MSAEDWIDDSYDSFEPLRKTPWRTKRKDFWYMKSGDAIKICDMTDEHLLNAFNAFGDKSLFKEMVWRLFEKRVKEAQR